jgi:hypothetical protein
MLGVIKKNQIVKTCNRDNINDEVAQVEVSNQFPDATG